MPDHIHSPNAKRHIARKMELWKAAVERGDADVLADALVSQSEIPETLKRKLELGPYSEGGLRAREEKKVGRENISPETCDDS